MQPQNQTDHIAYLSLMMVGVLTKRMKELGQLDPETANHLHKLVKSVRTHAASGGIEDLNALFDKIDKNLGLPDPNHKPAEDLVTGHSARH